MSWEKRWERGCVGERSEIGEWKAKRYGVEAESRNVEWKRMSHVESEEHGIGGGEESEGLVGE